MGAAVLAALLAAPLAAARGDTRLMPVREAAPRPLALDDLNGRRHALEDYRERVVLVNFWATWCEPCREEMPSIERLAQRFAGRPFAVLAVNYGESPIRIREFVARAALSFSVLLDPGQAAARAWRVAVLPASFLVGPDGRVRHAVVGAIDWTSPEVVDAVARLLP